jgi:predicted 2-oxoglutarate/Fe(II)-dependent dioxygenase YbiX
MTAAVLTMPGFYDPVACAKIRRAMDHAHASPAEICAEGFRIDREARRAFDVEISDDVLEEMQRAMNTILPEVGRFFGISLSRDEGPGFVRYISGGFYGRHCDVVPDWDTEFPRRISIVLVLSSAGTECEGGTLRLYRPDPFDILPRAGTLVAFPSQVPHEVLPVTDGVRDVVVDWFY